MPHDVAALTRLIAGGESQSVEFKSTLSSGAQNEAIESLAAFANASGGTILFGVTDHGKKVGVPIGARTEEDFANRVTRRTYPSLPVVVRVVGDVLLAEVQPSRPPIIGAFAAATRNIDAFSPVRGADLRWLRRIGKSNQQFEVGMLRAVPSSEPEILLYLGGAGQTAGKWFPRYCEVHYENRGVGSALSLSIRATHPVFECDGGLQGVTVPPATRVTSHVPTAKFAILDPDADVAGREMPVVLAAHYRDSAGLLWESTLELLPAQRDTEQQQFDFVEGARRIRVLEFPAKTSL